MPISLIPHPVRLACSSASQKRLYLLSILKKHLEAPTGNCIVTRAKSPTTKRMIGRFAVSPRRVLLGLTALSIFSTEVFASDGNWTDKHEAGRCAIRGQCGKKSFFGGELPCPDNGLADDPDEDTRKKLVAICGDGWSDGDVCCDSDQVGYSRGIEGENLANDALDRQPKHKPQARRIDHIILPGMQREFLQPFLHVHMLSRPVPLRQCYSVTESFVRKAHSNGIG